MEDCIIHLLNLGLESVGAAGKHLAGGRGIALIQQQAATCRIESTIEGAGVEGAVKY